MIILHRSDSVYLARKTEARNDENVMMLKKNQLTQARSQRDRKIIAWFYFISTIFGCLRLKLSHGYSLLSNQGYKTLHSGISRPARYQCAIRHSANNHNFADICAFLDVPVVEAENTKRTNGRARGQKSKGKCCLDDLQWKKMGSKLIFFLAALF